MTIKHTLAFLALALGSSGTVLASDPACARKIAGIETQLQHAKESGNQNRVNGLERALSGARVHCTDAKLIAEAQEDVADKQEDIDDILEDIRENEEEGKLDKVKRLERKLAHEREELKLLNQELAQIKGVSEERSK